MVRIYTKYNELKKYKGLRVIMDNDTFFEEEENGETGIDDTDYALMKKIDNVTFLNDIKSPKNTKSPFGLVRLFELSTGCKTAININHAIRDRKQVIISITECGENAVYECFKLADDKNITLLLQHGFILGIPNEFEFLINNEVTTTDINELSDYALRGDYVEADRV